MSDIRVVDFDAFRAEQQQHPVVFRIDGKEYPLPSDLPASVAVDIIRMRADVGEEGEIPLEAFDTFGKSVFGEDLWQTILTEHRITMEEVPNLLKAVLEVYTGEVPKAESLTLETPALSSALSTTGRGSKRTSSGNTAST